PRSTLFPYTTLFRSDEGFRVCLLPSEVNYDLFCLFDIQGQVVLLTPSCQSVNFVSVGTFISVGDLSYHSRVICKFVELLYLKYGCWCSHMCRRSRAGDSIHSLVELQC